MPEKKREKFASGRMKGGVFRAHMAWVREHHGDEGVRQLMDDLPAEMSEALSGRIMVSSWYPFEWLMTLDRAIDKRFGRGDGALFDKLGRFSAEMNLSTTYRAFDRSSNHEFFRNSALLHSQFQDFGTAEYVKESDTSGKMIHREYDSYSPDYCASALGYYTACLEIHGAYDVRVRETSCQCAGEESCTFEMSWRE